MLAKGLSTTGACSASCWCMVHGAVHFGSRHVHGYNGGMDLCITTQQWNQIGTTLQEGPSLLAVRLCLSLHKSTEINPERG